MTGREEHCEETKTDLRRRTIGRTSLYSPRKQRATVPPRAGAATSSRRALTAPGPADATPPAKQVAQAATPVSAAQATAQMPNTLAPGAAPQTQEELIKELQGWKQLALKLLDEREKGK